MSYPQVPTFSLVIFNTSLISVDIMYIPDTLCIMYKHPLNVNSVFLFALIKTKKIIKGTLSKYVDAPSSCTFRGREDETLMHSFLYCEFIQKFWSNV